MVAVIAIHALASTETFGKGSWQHAFGLVARQFLNFAVPLFLALSGYFAGRAWDGTGRQDWRSRAWRILSPFLLWTALYVLVRSPRHYLDPLELLLDVVLGRGIVIGYFVIVLLQYVLLTPLLGRLKTTRGHVTVMVLGSVAGMVMCYGLQVGFRQAQISQFPYYCLLFLAWYPFYHLGFWAGQGLCGWLDGRPWLGLSVPIFGLAIAEAFSWSALGLHNLATSQIKLTSFLASLAVFFHVVASRDAPPRGPAARMLRWLGQYSFALYLMHILILHPVVGMIHRFAPGLYQQRPLAVVAVTLVVVAMCAAAVVVLRGLLPATWRRHVLGVGNPSPRHVPVQPAEAA